MKQNIKQAATKATESLEGNTAHGLEDALILLTSQERHCRQWREQALKQSKPPIKPIANDPDFRALLDQALRAEHLTLHWVRLAAQVSGVWGSLPGLLWQLPEEDAARLDLALGWIPTLAAEHDLVATCWSGLKVAMRENSRFRGRRRIQTPTDFLAQVLWERAALAAVQEHRQEGQINLPQLIRALSQHQAAAATRSSRGAELSFGNLRRLAQGTFPKPEIAPAEQILLEVAQARLEAGDRRVKEALHILEVRRIYLLERYGLIASGNLRSHPSTREEPG